MYSRSFWHQSLCESADAISNTKSFLTNFPLLPTQQSPPPFSTIALIRILEPSEANPRTSFSTAKHRSVWPSDHLILPSSQKSTDVRVPLIRNRSEMRGWLSGWSIGSWGWTEVWRSNQRFKYVLVKKMGPVWFGYIVNRI